jgi:hypothetical protein
MSNTKYSSKLQAARCKLHANTAESYKSCKQIQIQLYAKMLKFLAAYTLWVFFLAFFFAAFLGLL